MRTVEKVWGPWGGKETLVIPVEPDASYAQQGHAVDARRRVRRVRRVGWWFVGGGVSENSNSPEIPNQLIPWVNYHFARDSFKSTWLCHEGSYDFLG